MEAEEKTTNNQVQFASVDLKVSEDYNAQFHLAPPSAGSQLRNAIVAGGAAVVAGALAVAVFLLNFGPSLLFWALILLWPARWAWRRIRARRVDNKSAAGAAD